MTYMNSYYSLHYMDPSLYSLSFLTIENGDSFKLSLVIPGILVIDTLIIIVAFKSEMKVPVRPNPARQCTRVRSGDLVSLF